MNGSKTFIWIRGLLFLCLVCVCMVGAETLEINARDYPSFSEKEIGHLRWIIKLADQLPGDWSYMDSGHLLHMISLYEMLFRDMKYDKPGSITVIWEEMFPMSKKKEVAYDHKSLAEVIHRQFLKNRLHMIECEPNALFSACNQHPMLGLMLYDHTHGTNLSAVKEMVRKTFYDRKLVDPETHNFMKFYMVHHNRLVPNSSSAVDGWTGAFMHAWDPQLIEFHYPFQAEKYVKWYNDGTANAHIMFALLAKEIGDDKTAEGILAWFDKNFPSQWQDGMLCYVQKSDNIRSYRWTEYGELVRAVARITVKNGLWTLHNRPWGDDHFVRHFISHVEYPKTIVKQAYYDPLKEALIVALLAGTNDAGTTSFTVNNLDKSKPYSINKDGETLGNLENGILLHKSRVKEIEWKADGTLTISTDLVEPHTFLIYAQK